MLLAGTLAIAWPVGQRPSPSTEEHGSPGRPELALANPYPESGTPAPSESTSGIAGSAEAYDVTVQLEQGQTLGSALQQVGLTDRDVGNAVQALSSHVDFKHLPIGQAMLLKEYPDRRKALVLGIWGFYTLLPFTIGFPVGGWIADELGWRELFLLNVPVGLLIAGLVGGLLYGRGFVPSYVNFDFVGFLLLAVIIGGVSLSGGEGRVLGTVIGAFIIGVLSNGLNLAGVEPFWQYVAQGLVLIAAVVVDRRVNLGVLRIGRK